MRRAAPEICRPRTFNLHLDGEAIVDPVKPYSIDMVEHKAVANRLMDICQ